MVLSIEKALASGIRLPSFGAMFSSPAATLDSLRGRPRWFYPLLVAAAYSVAVNLYLVHRIGIKRLIAAALQANAAIDPQAVLDSALANKTQILFFQGVSAFIGTFLTAFVVAKVLWLILTMIGEDISFKKVLAVVAHVSLLTIVIRESMMALTVTAMRNLDHFDLHNPLATNLGFFIRPGSPVAHRLLTTLDLITIVNIFLLALGLSKLSDRLSIRTAHILVIIPWGVYIGATLLLPLLF